MAQSGRTAAGAGTGAGAGGSGRTALCVHHDPDASLGLLETVLADRGFVVRSHSVGTSLEDPAGSGEFPDLTAAGDAVDLLVVMGSRWSVTDPRAAHWVEPELELLRAADRAAVPVLGVCFGAQLLAAAHGGRVEAAPAPEIGWFDLTACPESADEVATDRANPTDRAGRDGALADAIVAGPWFEWHGDRVEPPPGSDVLARTDVCVQAFTLRANLGVQFHPEVDPATLDLWLRHDRDQLTGLGVDVARLVERTRAERDRAAIDLAALFDRWWDSLS